MLPFAPNASKGFTLVEVLVAILILSIGILGLASLESHTLQTNKNAYERSQATILSYEIADKMRANKGANYALLEGVEHEGLCISEETPCDAVTLAQQEIYQWEASINSILPSGQGTISQNGDAFVIEISWDDLNEDVAAEEEEAVEEDEDEDEEEEEEEEESEYAKSFKMELWL